VQHNMRTSEDNDRLRFGLRWRLNDSSWFRQQFAQLNMTYSLTLHALQIDNRDESVWQLEHRWRLWQQWYAVAEYRLNQYRREDVNNLTLGVEYRVPF
jgi:hypothetical protein